MPPRPSLSLRHWSYGRFAFDVTRSKQQPNHNEAVSGLRIGQKWRKNPTDGTISGTEKFSESSAEGSPSEQRTSGLASLLQGAGSIRIQVSHPVAGPFVTFFSFEPMVDNRCFWCRKHVLHKKGTKNCHPTDFQTTKKPTKKSSKNTNQTCLPHFCRFALQRVCRTKALLGFL